MERFTLCIAAGATLVTTLTGPAAANDPLEALRLLGPFISQIDTGDRQVSRRFYHRDDDDDDGDRRRAYQGHYRYADDDDDDNHRGQRRGHGHRQRNDDDD